MFSSSSESAKTIPLSIANSIRSSDRSVKISASLLLLNLTVPIFAEVPNKLSLSCSSKAKDDADSLPRPEVKSFCDKFKRNRLPVSAAHIGSLLSKIVFVMCTSCFVLVEGFSYRTLTNVDAGRASPRRKLVVTALTDFRSGCGFTLVAPTISQRIRMLSEIAAI